MAFEDLKDRLTEQAQGYWSRIQESNLYIQLHEKYADLNPTSQKIVLALGSTILILVTLMIPWSYISSSQLSIADFEANKLILRDLYRVSRASGELEGAPPPVDPNGLASRAQSQLQTMNLQAEQIEKVIAVDNALGGPGIPGVPKAVQQKGIEVTIRKLNVRQVIEIGYQLLTLQPGLKMTGLTVTASIPDPHYFDAIYKIISFSLPAPAADVKAPPKRGGGSKRSKPAEEDAPGDEE